MGCIHIYSSTTFFWSEKKKNNTASRQSLLWERGKSSAYCFYKPEDVRASSMHLQKINKSLSLVNCVLRNWMAFPVWENMVLFLLLLSLSLLLLFWDNDINYINVRHVVYMYLHLSLA